MKKIFFYFLIISIVSLAITETSLCKKNDEEFLDKIIGTYEYIYKYNTKNFIENHYIILEVHENQLKGWYYGTSDDFETMREGYEPGFFVKEMSDLNITLDTIKFKLDVNFKEFYTKPISLQYRNIKQIPKGKYKKWEAYAGNESFRSRIYNGVVKDNKIELKIGDEYRIFKKIRGK